MLQTTVAGSLPKPAWLAVPEQLWAPWQVADDALWQAQCDAALVVLKEQEDIGIDIVSNGEVFRQHFVHGVLQHIDGIDHDKRTTIGIRADRYEADVPTVTGPVARSRPIHADEVAYTRAHTTRKLKFTLPGPMTIVDTIADEHYGDRPTLAMAFAEVLNQEARELEAMGVDVIQFDEPAFNVYMDEVKSWGIEALECAAEGLNCTKAVHICYGYGIQANLDWKTTLGGEWAQYRETFPVLAKSSIDQVSLECANSHVPIELIGLLDGKDVLVGVIDVATDAIETPEEVADTIRAAMSYVEPEKLYPCTNCGMVPLTRDLTRQKLQALVAGTEIVRAELGAA